MMQQTVYKIIVNDIMKKLSFLFITLVLLNGCAVINNIKDTSGIFCSDSDEDNRYFTVLKLDTNNTFELECIIQYLGIVHYYSKGESYISKRKIILKLEKNPVWTYPSPEPFNLYYNYTYSIKVISKNEVIMFIDNQKGETLRLCDCIPERFIIKKNPR